MPARTVYVFYFSGGGCVERIPYAKWKRISSGEKLVNEFSNLAVHIAYAYILLENKKPVYCPLIEGHIHYFDEAGRMVLDELFYFDLLQDTDEAVGGVIILQHRKKKKAAFEKYCWELNSRQIQAVVDCIW
ncbi:MAG: hypothetical protein OEZ15_10505 [Gammaproteobacteria bacterium]|nr:hypothetical protein [Gammaproteobacteria bacterium]